MRNVRYKYLCLLLSVTSIACIGIPLNAGETTVYRYDELGRLVKVTQAGSINNGIVTDIEYDEAGNRKDYKVTGSNGSGSGGGVTGVEGNASGGGGAPNFLISDATAIEGAGVSFTIAKQGGDNSTYSVSYATANGDALAGSDYSARSGTLTFTGSQNSQIISVSSINDSVFEQTEVFYLNLISATGGATIGDAQGAGTISDNDIANRPPRAITDNFIAPCIGAVSFNVKVNDVDPDDGDAITVTSVGVPGGSISGGSIVNFPSRAISATYSYVLTDSHGLTDVGTINFTRNCGVNNPGSQFE